jgi:hypothetical protein
LKTINLSLAERAENAKNDENRVIATCSPHPLAKGVYGRDKIFDDVISGLAPRVLNQISNGTPPPVPAMSDH